MKNLRLKTGLLLVGLFCLTSTTTIQAQDDAARPIEQTRFRLFGGRGNTGDESRDAQDRGAEDEPAKAPAMVEPIKMPTFRGPAPTSQRQTTPDGQPADPLLELVQRAIDLTAARTLDANAHTPWQIMHGMLALRGDMQLRSGNSTVRAIDWLSAGPKFRNQFWFEATPYGGRPHPFNVPFHFEGHPNQFLALMALTNLPLEHQFTVAGGKTVTIADMIQNAKMTVNTREEITWTLWFLTHYIDQDSEWENAAGQPWSMEQLVRIQTQASTKGTPCGGTHGLFALAYARNAYLQKHRTLRGVWFEADQKIKRHIEVAKSLQNSDGSLSTEFFTGRGVSQDYNERIKASGHTLECLMMMLPHSQLSENWVRRAVASVATDLVHTSGRPTECGPTFHALSSLVLYRERVAPRPPVENLAEQSPGSPAATQRPNATPLPEVSASVTADSTNPAWKAHTSAEPQLSAEPPVPQPQDVAAQSSPTPLISVPSALPARISEEVVADSKPIVAQQPLAATDTAEPVPLIEMGPLPAPTVAEPRSDADPDLERRDRLAHRAAERLAEMIRRSRPLLDRGTPGEDHQPLQSPATRDAERIAAEPRDAPVIR